MKYLCISFSLLSVMLSAIIHVPDEYSSIQQGINSSSHGDTVLVQPGTYIENINYNGKNIVVGSLTLLTGDTTYIHETIIDGNQTGSVVTIESGEDSTTVLCGFTLTNGSGSITTQYALGGGLFCEYSSPLIENMIISNNTVEGYGGGIYIHTSNVKLYNVNVINNFSEFSGGGVAVWLYSNLLFENVNIVENTVNPEGGEGGGLFCIGYNNITMINMKINGNSAWGGGGILSTSFNNLYLENVEISENHAIEIFGGGHGGGISFGHESTLNCTNVTIAQNVADGWGDGIFIASYDTEIYFYDSILWNSITDNIYFYYDYYNSYNNSIIISHSDIQGGLDGIETNGYGIINWLDGNIDTDPLFVDPDIGNYYLQLNSPCIDAGDPYSSLDPDGTIADMGAYYFHQTIICPLIGDLNNDSFINIIDIVTTVGCILEESNECGCADMNSDNIIDVVDITLMVGIILG